MNTIKKILLAVVIALTAVGISEAKPIAFGVKAGLNVNNLKFNKDIAKSDNSCGWTAGVMADFTIPIIGLGCDVSLMYSRMNNSSNVTYEPGFAVPNPDLAGSTQIGEQSINNSSLYGKNFIEIPINLKYKLTLPVISNYLKPYVFTGPNFAFRLGKNLEDNVRNIKSRTCQIAWNVGLGVEVFNHVQIGASYAFGINNIVERINLGDFHTSDIKAKNNYWTVSAAYLF